MTMTSLEVEKYVEGKIWPAKTIKNGQIVPVQIISEKMHLIIEKAELSDLFPSLYKTGLDDYQVEMLNSIIVSRLADHNFTSNLIYRNAHLVHVNYLEDNLKNEDVKKLVEHLAQESSIAYTQLFNKLTGLTQAFSADFQNVKRKLEEEGTSPNEVAALVEVHNNVIKKIEPVLQALNASRSTAGVFDGELANLIDNL